MTTLRASVTADALGENLITNGGLVGSTTGWATSSDGGPNTPTITYVDPANLPAGLPNPDGLTGSGAAKITYTGSNNNNTPFPAGVIWTHSALTVGKTYVLSIWLYVPSGTTDPANTGITDMQLLTGGTNHNLSGQRDQWVQVWGSFTANAANPVLALWTGGSCVAGQYFYATGAMIQEGSTLGVFAQGGGADGDQAPILVDGSDTAVTANGLAGYTPSPGDRLLVQQVGGAVEVVQFISRGRTPWLDQQHYTDLNTRISTAQTAANNAQTSANGKNTVHYSTGTPGTTANTAGDVWFQEDGTGVVIAQWIGAGGTSWTSVEVGSAVIAALDAGKITTGTLSAITIDGCTIETAATGNRIAIYDSAGVGHIDFYANIAGETPASVTSQSLAGAPELTLSSGTIPAETHASEVQLTPGATAAAASVSIVGELVLPSGAGMNMIGGTAAFSGDISHSTGTAAFNAVTINSLSGGLVMSGQLKCLNDLLVTGGSGITASTGDVHGQNLWVDSTPSSTSGANVHMGASGRLFLITSLGKWKVEKQPLTDPARILDIDPITWFDRTEWEDNGESTEGLHRIPGVLAEQVAEVFPEFVIWDDEDKPRGVHYDRLTVALLPLVKDLRKRVARLESEQG